MEQVHGNFTLGGRQKKKITKKFFRYQIIFSGFYIFFVFFLMQITNPIVTYENFCTVKVRETCTAQN